MLSKLFGVTSLVAIFGFFYVHAESTGAGGSATPGATSASRSADDFNREFKCGMGLKTTFANGMGNIGGSTMVASPNLILVPATRHGKRGYYAVTKDNGAQFHPYAHPAHTIASINTYYVTITDPATKEPMTISIDSFEDEYGKSDIFYKYPDNGAFLKSIGENPQDLVGSKVNDATAQNDLTQEYASEIKQAAKFVGLSTKASRVGFGSIGFLNGELDDGASYKPLRKNVGYKPTRKDIVGSLNGIVCGCQGIAGLEQPIQDLLASSEVQPYKSEIGCNAISPH